MAGPDWRLWSAVADRQADFAELTAGLEPVEGGVDVAEREDRVDMRGRAERLLTDQPVRRAVLW